MNWDFLMEELENEKLVKRLPKKEYSIFNDIKINIVLRQ